MTKKLFKDRYIINRIWIFVLKFFVPVLINLYYVFEFYDSEKSYSRIFITSIVFFIFDLAMLIAVLVLSFRQARNYQWANGLEQKSTTKWNHYIFERRLARKNETKMNIFYSKQMSETWNKNIEMNKPSEVKNKKGIDIIYIYYLFVSSLISLIISVISLIAHYGEIKNYLNLTYGKIVFCFIIGMCIYFLLITIINGIILQVNRSKNSLRINNQDLLNSKASKQNLKDYVLLDAISYLPKNRETFFRYINIHTVLFSFFWIMVSYLIFDPIAYFSSRQYRLLKTYKNFEDPKITILSPSKELIFKLKEARFKNIEIKEQEITITFDKEHVEYPKLIKLIYQEKNLHIITNDKYFKTIYEIALEEVYQSSLEQTNCLIETQNILEWQKENYLDKKYSRKEEKKKELEEIING
ncbi:hypothetical protein [[Mycoplasma] anseris]|uniref:Uncharacterized protein n=1 Tax=[Mycoplasma] anseris TaxID=92400 RepID=A0A2Z4NCQ3_9BACT|nr:hypothetical protein [[Mycoplasma] anseris]AWX69348.1 hypothetical protein DP065_01080 [[Mycoplasma] anseris]